jgi:host factor-I protein
MNESFSEQESFLDRLIDEHASVSVFLINGIRLSGTIQSYDQNVVLLGSPSGVQTVFKHSVSTIQTSDHRPPKAGVRASATSYPKQDRYPRRKAAAT